MYTYLIKEISLGGLLDSLYAEGAISEKHMSGIKQHRDDNNKIRELLPIMLRRSFAQFNTFIACLRSTDQEHISDMLESNGGITYIIIIIIFFESNEWNISYYTPEYYYYIIIR